MRPAITPLNARGEAPAGLLAHAGWLPGTGSVTTVDADGRVREQLGQRFIQRFEGFHWGAHGNRSPCRSHW